MTITTHGTAILIQNVALCPSQCLVDAQLPSLGSAMCACTWHFFYNAEELEVRTFPSVRRAELRRLSEADVVGSFGCSTARISQQQLLQERLF